MKQLYPRCNKTETLLRRNKATRDVVIADEISKLRQEIDDLQCVQLRIKKTIGMDDDSYYRPVRTLFFVGLLSAAHEIYKIIM